MNYEQRRVSIDQCGREEERTVWHTIVPVIDHTRSLSRIPLRCIWATRLATLLVKRRLVSSLLHQVFGALAEVAQTRTAPEVPSRQRVGWTSPLKGWALHQSGAARSRHRSR